MVGVRLITGGKRNTTFGILTKACFFESNEKVMVMMIPNEILQKARSRT